MRAQKGSRADSPLKGPVGTEDPPQQLISEPKSILAVARELAAIVLCKRSGVLFDRLDPQAIVHRWTQTPDARHQLFHYIELIESGPVRIALAPARVGFQPYRKSLREVFRRMGLCVPFTQMVYITAATGPSLVVSGILQ